MVGNYPLVPQGGDSRRYHTADNMTWQRGRHQLRFGFEWQFDRSDGFLTLFEPAAMVLYSPQIVQAFNADPRVPPQARIPIPASFRTLNDILQLPLVGASIGFGDPRQPPSFRLEDARNDHIIRFYWQDRWRVRPRFSLNYGLAYHYQTNLTNHDLSKPEYLAPLLGSSGLAPTKRDGNNFAPALGLGLGGYAGSQNCSPSRRRALLRAAPFIDASVGTFNHRSKRHWPSGHRWIADS